MMRLTELEEKRQRHKDAPVGRAMRTLAALFDDMAQKIERLR